MQDYRIIPKSSRLGVIPVKSRLILCKVENNILPFSHPLIGGVRKGSEIAKVKESFAIGTVL